MCLGCGPVGGLVTACLAIFSSLVGLPSLLFPQDGAIRMLLTFTKTDCARLRMFHTLWGILYITVTTAVLDTVLYFGDLVVGWT